jgi:hypothetical protein
MILWSSLLLPACPRRLSKSLFSYALAALGFVLLLPGSAHDARALRVGFTESYEGWGTETGGTKDYRGRSRHERLVEVLAGWKDIGVDFGVLVGDNIANSETYWPLLLEAIQDSEIPVYMALGNHDWVNMNPDGNPPPDSCFNLKPQEQHSGCPNYLYFLDYLWSNYGYTRPWYSFESEGVLFIFLADELLDSRGDYGVGISDIHDEQFYWFRDLVSANTDKPIVVFAHHPVRQTLAGSYGPNALNRLAWRPRVGEEAADTISVTNSSTLAIRAGEAFDFKRVTVGAEFQIQGETQWYEIAAINGSELSLTTPYQGPTNSAALFWAGGHFNEFNEIVKNPSNSIVVVGSGHTGLDFQWVDWAGAAQLEYINGKIFAFAGNLHPVDIHLHRPLGDFTGGSPVSYLTQTQDSFRIVPGAKIRPGAGSYIDVVDVSWATTLGGKSTVTLASTPEISVDYLGVATFSQETDPFTQTRVLDIDSSSPWTAEITNFNYATGWRSGALLERNFDDPGFPRAKLSDATLALNAATARLTPTSVHGVALYGDSDQHFYSVEVEFERVSGGGGGIVFRAQDGSNFYYFELDESSQTFKLGKCESGALTTLAEVDPGGPLTDGYTLKVRVQDSRIQTFVDDQPAIMHYDTTFPTGLYGLFSRSVSGSDFENLEVFGDIEPYPVPEPGQSQMFLLAIATVISITRKLA